MSKASQRDINIRSAIGANFAGIGHQGLVKLCGVLNVPPPIDDDHFSRTIIHILPVFESHKLNSMKNAIEEACGESNKREEYDHNKHSLSLGIMKAIRPVFDELAHPDALKKVINGGSQNNNESFHAVLWSLAPENRYTTGVVIDLYAAIAVLSYNEGDQSILPVIAELTGGGCGFYTKFAMRRLDERRVYSEHKRKQTEEKTK
ncbi:unnamed protein product [Rotaria sp. Silwood1]|nr:unnamed protein product [Rotaria sp. Silwood1]CAF1469605.1 unnamed protein product [Rotaria sp. Silwood1]CAF3630912.1 unnamed protein product [Rotaria sp. Silwood1]